MPDHDPILQTLLSDLGYDPECQPLEPIGGGQSGGRVFRLRSESHGTLILKLLEPDRIPAYLRQDYPHIAEAEPRFYTELAPELGIPLPTIYQAGQISGGCWFLLMEDLGDSHRIPQEGHLWTESEMRAVLSTYAMLHGRSMELLAGQPAPGWLHQDDRRRFSPAVLMTCLQSFYDNHWTRGAVTPIVHSPMLAPLLERVEHGLESTAPSLLFNDFYPPNVALPRHDGPAKLFDWQLVGVGPLHIDIVNIGFLSRQDGFAQVDGQRLLDFYLDRLFAETGIRLDVGRFMHDYRLAALLAWGVFMPRMVAAMRLANAQGKRFSPWMERAYGHCMSEWVQAITQC